LVEGDGRDHSPGHADLSRPEMVVLPLPAISVIRRLAVEETNPVIELRSAVPALYGSPVQSTNAWYSLSLSPSRTSSTITSRCQLSP